jgi:predicted DCC family thiol-disulfide oxidoreductase YuxK
MYMNRSILFFDGECHLCNRLVQFIIQRSDPLQVASLQSDTAKMLLKQNHAGILALNTLVLFENNILYIKSDAVLRILRKMHGLWPLLYVFKFVPVSVRDKLYEVLANNRRRWFWKSENCLIRSKTTRDREAGL